MILFFLSCTSTAVVEAEAPVCTDDCPDYTTAWAAACPVNDRCLTFHNSSLTETVYLAYQIGCNGDGTPGSPQCNCTTGPELLPNAIAVFVVLNGNYSSCTPWTPACLTSGLAVLANTGAASCASGTRIEFTAGNTADPFGQFDSYNLSVIEGYSVPVSFKPDLTCAVDHTNHDCRPLWCDSATCPDAYDSPTSGGCGFSPQVGCQDTFGLNLGFKIEYFPAPGSSCQDTLVCPL